MVVATVDLELRGGAFCWMATAGPVYADILPDFLRRHLGKRPIAGMKTERPGRNSDRRYNLKLDIGAGRKAPCLALDKSTKCRP